MINLSLKILLFKYCSVAKFNLLISLARLIEKFQPDLMLLDLKLPDIDGYSLLKQVQEKPDLSKIPIIVVSAFAFKADQELALSLGARRYFVKPIKLKDLIITIEEELTCCHK
ncbi:response regulator [Nostoc commune]|uniref:response regulator n=1 Tax=Nostoc commune TaxID=1178 RepID=UPI001E4C7B75|nr:response regulator [Nostoc commune]